MNKYHMKHLVNLKSEISICVTSDFCVTEQSTKQTERL